MKIHHLVLPLVLASSLLAGCAQSSASPDLNAQNAAMPNNAVMVNNPMSGVIVASRFVSKPGAENRRIEYTIRTKEGDMVKVVQRPPLMPTGTHVRILPGPPQRIVLSPRDQ